MARKINVMPVEPIELVFADGHKVEMLFTAKTGAIVANEFGGLLKVLRSAASDGLYPVGAKVIYAGMKTINDDATFEEAEKIASVMSANTLTEIIEEFTNSISGDQKQAVENLTEEQKAFIKEIISNQMK